MDADPYGNASANQHTAPNFHAHAIADWHAD
jgi:hypothetical protein